MEWNHFWTLVVQLYVLGIIMIPGVIIFFSIVLVAVRAFLYGTFAKKSQAESYTLGEDVFDD